MSPQEINAIAMSGPAWDRLVSAANSNWGTANLSDNNSGHDVLTLAGAIVAVRTNNPAMRSKVITALEGATGSKVARALELSRGLQTYIIAADMIGYRDPKFVSWVGNMITTPIQGHSGGTGVRGTAMNSANNWGGHARASMAAAAVYLNRADWLAEVTTAHKAFIGVAAPGSVMKYTGTNWHAGTPKAGINVAGAKINGQDVSGVQAEDWRRGAEFKWPPQHVGYMWEGMQGFVVTSVILHRAGTVPFSAGDNAVVRSMDILYRIGFAPEGEDTWIPYIVNKYAGTNYPEGTATAGKNMGWTDWTHATP